MNKISTLEKFHNLGFLGGIQGEIAYHIRTRSGL